MSKYMEWLSENFFAGIALVVSIISIFDRIRYRDRKEQLEFQNRMNHNFRKISMYLAKNDPEGWDNGIEYD